MSALWTVGYGVWPAARRAERLVAALRDHAITRLVDIRLSPCASDPVPGRRYGPKAWTLQDGGGGIASLAVEAGAVYEWLVELGNPQRHDPARTILRAHLADEAGGWPVHRGLERLAGRVREPGARVAVLCGCGTAASCHRTTIAQAVSDRHFGGALMIRHIG